MAKINAKTLAERAEKSRRFEHTFSNGWTFILRRPSDLQLEEALAIASRFGSNVTFKRDTVLASLAGWDGPKVADVDPEAPEAERAEALPFDASLGALLFEDRTDLLTEVADKLVEGYQARKKAREEAAKN